MGSEGGERGDRVASSEGGGSSGGGVGSSLFPPFVSSLLCRRPVLSSCCCRASLSHVAVAYNKQRRTMTNVVIHRLVDPFVAVVFAVVHCRHAVVSCVVVTFQQ